MTEYHKIPSVWLRDPATKHKRFLDGAWSSPELEYLKGTRWIGTEKVDGTNVRIIWDGHRVTFGGRTDNAQMPTLLIDVLRETFPEGAMEEQFRESPAVLYGEGYGAKIQKGGGDYRADQGFILFDVRVGPWWLDRVSCRAVATALGIAECPIVFDGTLSEGVEFVRDGFASRLKATPPEGVVFRPLVELSKRNGERLICKAKLKDFE